MMLGSVPLKRILLFCLSVGVAIALHLTPIIPPSLAQDSPQATESEPVVLDGTQLFRVTPAADLTAEERASIIHQRLEDFLNQAEQTDGNFNITVRQQDNKTLVSVNQRDLITVTQADADIAGAEDPSAQAEKIKASLEKALTQSYAERQEGYIIRAIPRATGVLIVAGLIHWLAGYLWRHQVRAALEKITGFNAQTGSTELTGVNLLLRVTLFGARAAMWLGAIYYVTNLFPFTRMLTYLVTEGLIDGLLARSLTLGENSYSVLDLVILMALLLALVIIASTFTNLLRSRILHITGINRGSQEAIAILAKYSLIFIGAVVILQIWGLDLSSLALIASALGVGIGLGLQNIAKDFVSGLIMVFERPVQVGDFVDFGEFLGTIERIGARSTEIRTIDHVSIIVPNSRFLEQEVINWSHRNPVSRLRVPVGVSYSANPAEVSQALLEACSQHQSVLKAPVPQVFFKGFGDSALEFELLVWIDKPSQQYQIKSDLYFSIEAALKKHGIEIPFPQRDLHIRSGSLPINLSAEAQAWLDRLNSKSG